MLGRNSLDRSTDYFPSPMITPSCQNDICSQTDSKVPATPRYLNHKRFFDQNVPSTPLTNLALPNIAPVFLREPESLNVSAQVWLNSDISNTDSSSKTAGSFDQMVPSTPEGCIQKKDAEEPELSPELSQEMMPIAHYQETDNNSLHRLSLARSSLLLNKHMSSCRRTDIKTNAWNLSDCSNSLPPTFADTPSEQSSANNFRETVSNISLSGGTSEHGPSSQLDPTSQDGPVSQDGSSPPQPNTLSELQSPVINRAEVTNIRRCSFDIQALLSSTNHDAVIEELFSGDEIFL